MRWNDRLGWYETFGDCLNLFGRLLPFRNPRQLIVAGGFCAVIATVVLSTVFWE